MSYILCIATCKFTLKSAKVKLCNTTQNIPLTSGTVTTNTVVVRTRLKKLALFHWVRKLRVSKRQTLVVCIA